MCQNSDYRSAGQREEQNYGDERFMFADPSET